jgi:hypothetical protein
MAMSAIPKLKVDEDFQHYNLREQRLFKCLPTGESNAVNTAELTDKFYKNEKTPLFAQNNVGVLIRKLAKKMDYNNEIWRLRRSDRQGPHSIWWWLEPRH